MSKNNQLFPICEISNEQTVSGRRELKVVLHEIHPDVDHYQHNGISWNEDYVKNNMGSVAGMSIVAEFLDDEKDVPHGHGMTGIREDDDNLPLFENAVVVGHFDSAEIMDIEIEGETKRCLTAVGVLDEMRYPNFVAWLKEAMENGVPKGSVEIIGKKENDNHIIYDGGWKEKGRVPQIYDYSGYAILGIKPADDSAIVMELNSKEETMDEKLRQELSDLVTGAISEQNAKWDEYWAKVSLKDAEITQLKADIAAKEAEIAQIRADYDAECAKSAAAEAGIVDANAKISEMEKKQKTCELEAALSAYTDEQKEIASAEISQFMEDPNSVEINAIVGKICTEIVKKSNEDVIAEINSEVDVFTMEDAPKHDDGGEVEIY